MGKSKCTPFISFKGAIFRAPHQFAPAFFWEDVFSMAVLALHTAYLVALATGSLGERGQMYLALAAYATYVINATQFLLKLRAARLQHPQAVSSVGAAA